MFELSASQPFTRISNEPLHMLEAELSGLPPFKEPIYFRKPNLISSYWEESLTTTDALSRSILRTSARIFQLLTENPQKALPIVNIGLGANKYLGFYTPMNTWDRDNPWDPPRFVQFLTPLNYEEYAKEILEWLADSKISLSL